MNVAGIDGCHAGWIMFRNLGYSVFHAVYNSFSELIDANPDLHRIFIDIPVGLPDAQHPRTIETLLRQKLPGKKSSVFNVPVVEAIYEPDHQKAKQIHFEKTGKGLSWQSLYIRSKIREVDHYLKNEAFTFEIFEAHPELCFVLMNDNQILDTRKADQAGYLQRLCILKKYLPDVDFLIQDARKSYKTREVKNDDILDALCLYLSNWLSGNHIPEVMEDENRTGNSGIRIRIAYPRI